ncbi:MAG: DUF1566 domain-containing protein [Paludibacteraceae bacterium]|nr:DUF1566 domain-containing protein [Paludibacteraceae bacterium]
MKKQVLTAFSIAIAGVTSYAVSYMQVLTEDGGKLIYPVDHVSEVNFFNSQDTILVSPSDTTSSNHDYVDLGLPSGTLWAAYNVGATKPEEFGDYFAWGETETKNVYSAETYKYGTAKMGEYDFLELDSLWKYNFGNEHPGTIDNLSTLLPEDDAATANWGKEWRMPTNEEMIELKENCYVVKKRDYKNKVNGMIFFKAKRTDDKGRFVDEYDSYYSMSDPHIFFPAADRYTDWSSRDGSSFYGYYLSSSLREERENVALGLDFDGYGVYADGGMSRQYGYPVRAVRAQKPERKIFTVNFYTSDSVLIESQKVMEFTSAKEILPPAKDDHVFVGWSTSIDCVSSDLSVYALYKSILIEDVHPYVDLGLPSGTLWATYNVGATKPEQYADYGDFFAWGDVVPDRDFTWYSYKYGKAQLQWDLYGLTKYNFEGGYPSSIDRLSTLLPEDDAATVSWGVYWRMPTSEELRELIENCEYSWTEVDGVKGANFTGPNGNSVFFPASGYCEGISGYSPRESFSSKEGAVGFYWSSSLNEKNNAGAYVLTFDENGVKRDDDARYKGSPIRAVRVEKNIKKK